MLRTAVLELLVRGVLRLDSRGPTDRYVGIEVTGLEAELDPPVAAVAASLGSGQMNLRALEHELSLTWATPRDYVWSEVVPALCDRGMARIVDRGWRGWLGQKLVLTDVGLAARAQLEERLTMLDRQFGCWVAENPARAAAYVAETGSAVLLAPTAWPQLRELYGRGRPGAGATGAAAGVAVAVGVTTLDPGFDVGMLAGRHSDVLGGWAAGGGGFGGGDGGHGGGGHGGGGCGSG